MHDMFQMITDRITAQLERGVRPWSKPWTGAPLASFDMPHNIAGRSYRGANVPYLWAVADERGYDRPLWLTFKQALDHGGAVRKGERGTPVMFWKIGAKPADGEGEGEGDASAKGRRSVLLRSYTVFNIAQCDGVEVPTGPVRPMEFERLAAAEELLKASGAKIRYGGDRAFYVPSLDYVQLPHAETFRDCEGFYGTAFHELGHWTGHESRLARTFGKRFGDDAYAAEELVAELTAAFVTATLNLANPEREDHASYLACWLRVLKADNRAIVTAASAAQKAADFILQAKAYAGDMTADEAAVAMAA